jgi:eukaryotic-like serine/threonine-protein kinase
VQVNQGVNVSNFIPTITHTGVSLSPATGSAQNFNNLVNYTVTAEDGSTKRYVVKTVFVRANQKIFVGSSDGNVYAINANNGTELWRYTTGGAIHSSPLLAGNTLYIGSMDKNLYALDAATGALKWKYLTTAPIRSESPVISNGVVFISSKNNYPDGNVYAIDATTGLLKWNKQISWPTSPVVSGGKVFINSNGGSFYTLDEATGNVIWSTVIGLGGTLPTVINDKIYFACSGGQYQLKCINTNTGTNFWNAVCSSVATRPAIADGNLYVSSSFYTEQYVEAFSAGDGSFKWRYMLLHAGNSNTIVGSCVVTLDSLVLPGFHYGDFTALKTNGTVAWHYGPANSGWYSNPVAANKVVYVGASDNYLHAIDATNGTLIWKFATNGGVISGACLIDSDNTIIHAGSSGARN